MEFKLTIKLGNEAMQTGDDVAEALEAIAERVRSFYSGTVMQPDYSGTQQDLNGNTVGNWGVCE